MFRAKMAGEARGCWGLYFYRTELPQKFRLPSLGGQYSENGGLDVQDTEAGVHGRVQGIGGQAREGGGRHRQGFARAGAGKAMPKRDLQDGIGPRMVCEWRVTPNVRTLAVSVCFSADSTFPRPATNSGRTVVISKRRGLFRSFPIWKPKIGAVAPCKQSSCCPC